MIKKLLINKNINITTEVIILFNCFRNIEIDINQKFVPAVDYNNNI